MKTISVIDSHTGGEPTRIIVEGGPDLGNGTIADQANRFENEFDYIRTAVISEPRGSDVLVGGILCQTSDSSNAAGIIFFDNAGLLGMCGHGTIGLAVTLHYMGRLEIGSHTFETPVGNVGVDLLSPNEARIRNIASYRTDAGLEIDVPGYGKVVGDVAWGGNWFFITSDSPIKIDPANTDDLLRYSKAIRCQLHAQGHVGNDGGAINHVELQGPPADRTADAKNFVLCPGGAYDRSPCGTGTSAKLACLAAAGKLSPGATWRQESIVGSIFETSFEFENGETGDRIIPAICGNAYISGEAKLVLDPADPFCHGILA